MSLTSEFDGFYYTISGVKICFPYRAYPSQVSMMDRIIKALQRNQSCLIESPTGSGKTMALLCSCIAWQQLEQVLLNEKAIRDQLVVNSDVDSQEHISSAVADKTFAMDDDDDFKDIKKPQQIATTTELNSEIEVPSTGLSAEGQPAAKKASYRAPKIYFGTRTHKQITQIMRELKRSRYSNIKISILAGREHTCIFGPVASSSNKNEECRSLMDPQNGAQCPYYRKLKKSYDAPKPLRQALKNSKLEIFDIEDIVKVAKEHSFCPYFATTRILPIDAELIVCPYNYITDPVIRNSMNLVLKGQIVILDEAHNIEDSCREAASCKVTEEELNISEQNLMQLVHIDASAALHRPVLRMLSRIKKWMHDESQSDQMARVSHEVQQQTWTGTQIVPTMKTLDLSLENLEAFQKYLTDVQQDEDDDKERTVRPSTHTINTIGKLCTALSFLYRNDYKFSDDYRVCLMRELVYDSENTFRSRRTGAIDICVSLNFWCLNPGVAFSEVGESARSIILTSGTLSPLSTFSSELCHNFQYCLETSHVISPDQVFVASVGKGPRGGVLRATYDKSDDLLFQDDLGQLIINVCRTVPGGVLCFFPSYKLLEKLVSRWSATTFLEQLSKYKLVLSEPRKGDSLPGTLRSFTDAVISPKSISAECTGALLLAVCRGKISEGIDFADDDARAVITVGIPYPNVKDLVVDLKKKYNDQLCQRKKALSGREWYEIQAFRALNQALGRCIRHKDDWGALILVDERFVKEPNRYCSGLSKWIKEKVLPCHEFSTLVDSLKQFTSRRTENISNGYSSPNGASSDLNCVTKSGCCKQEKRPFTDVCNGRDGDGRLSSMSSVSMVSSMSHISASTHASKPPFYAIPENNRKKARGGKQENGRFVEFIALNNSSDEESSRPSIASDCIEIEDSFKISDDDSDAGVQTPTRYCSPVLGSVVPVVHGKKQSEPRNMFLTSTPEGTASQSSKYFSQTNSAKRRSVNLVSQNMTDDSKIPCVHGLQCVSCQTQICVTLEEFATITMPKFLAPLFPKNVSRPKCHCTASSTALPLETVFVFPPSSARSIEVLQLFSSTGIDVLNCCYDQASKVCYQKLICSTCASTANDLTELKPVAFKVLFYKELQFANGEETVIVGPNALFCQKSLPKFNSSMSQNRNY